MIKTALAIEREVDDTRSIRDTGASSKSKENQSSSSSRKKAEDFCFAWISRTRSWPPRLRLRLIIQGWEALQYS